MRIVSFVAFFFLISLTPASAADLPYDTLNRALTEQVVLPAYEKLVPAMEGLARAATSFCASSDSEGHARLTDAFHTAMEAWQRAQPIAFGPIAKDGRAARIEFWPDTGSTDRQLRRVLRERPAAMVTDGGLDGKSVALQSLATFERLLIENGTRLATATAHDEDIYACAWMVEIAHFQTRLVTTILDEWKTGYAQTVIGAGTGNATYADAQSASTDYLKSLAGIFDIIVRQKLERPMDASVAKARASRAESWRTKRSLANIVANLETARDLFILPAGFGDLLTAAGAGPLSDGMRIMFDEAVASAHGLGKPLEDAIGDTAARPGLDDLLRQIKALRTLVGGSLATETGLTIGFNSLDGD